MNVNLTLEPSGSILAELRANSLFISKIRELQKVDTKFMSKFELAKSGENSDFLIEEDECLYFKGWLCLTNGQELKHEILNEAHSSVYSIHPMSTKMYNDLKQRYWWLGMKYEIIEFVSRCLIC